MPIPETYTEEELAEYMHETLRAVAGVLGWSVAGGSYTEPVNETLVAYGQPDISQITGLEAIRKLRTLARVEAWRAVVSETVADYDYQADGGNFHRSQAHAHAKAMLYQAEQDALAFSPVYRVIVNRVDHKHDPYQYREDEDREL